MERVNKMERVNISIDAETRKKLDFLSDITRTNKSKIIRIAVKELEARIRNEMCSYLTMLEE